MALAAGIGYVLLAAREKAACWIFGIVSCSAIAWDDFTSFKLYADGVLQIIYILMGIWGLWQWLRGSEGGKLPVQVRSWSEHVAAIAIALMMSWPVAWLLQNYTDAAYGYLDTLTTILSLYATWLLIRKALGNWLYWIAIDAVYIVLFYRTGGVLVSVLYSIFLFVSVYGFFRWKRTLSVQQVIQTPSK